MSSKSSIILMSAVNLWLLLFCGCKSSHHTTIRQLRETDISQSIICHDTVFGEPEMPFVFVDGIHPCLWSLGHIEPLGFRGPQYQRFYIHYDSVVRQGDGSYQVEGRTRCRDTVRHFSGFIVLDSIVPYTDSIGLEYAEELGIIHAHYVFNEDKSSVGAGVLSGKVSYDYAKLNGRFYYGAILNKTL